MDGGSLSSDVFFLRFLGSGVWRRGEVSQRGWLVTTTKYSTSLWTAVEVARASSTVTFRRILGLGVDLRDLCDDDVGAGAGVLMVDSEWELGSGTKRGSSSNEGVGEAAGAMVPRCWMGKARSGYM